MNDFNLGGFVFGMFLAAALIWIVYFVLAASI